MSFTKLSVSALTFVSVFATTAAARDEIRIVGSSTVFPYTQLLPNNLPTIPARHRRSSNPPAPVAA